MKRIKVIRLLSIMLLLYSCSSKAPTKNDIVGTWLNQDGAEIQFMQNETFIGKSLPADIMITEAPEYLNKKFDCYGKWSITSKAKSWDQLPWRIELDYVNTSGIDYNQSSSFLIIAGSNFLENKAPWKCIFTWKGDEDAAYRYIFKKN